MTTLACEHCGECFRTPLLRRNHITASHPHLLSSSPASPEHLALARQAAERGDVSSSIKHYNLAVGRSGWKVCLEAAQVLDQIADSTDAATAAELFAVQCARKAQECAQSWDVVAAQIRGLGIASRLARLRGDTESARRHMQSATELGSVLLNPKTAMLPRLSRSMHKAHALEAQSTGLCLWRLPGLLGSSECELLVRVARPMLQGSEMGGSVQMTHRSSSTAWIPTSTHPTLLALTERVARILGLPSVALLAGESPDCGQLQVVHYKPGEQYRVHHDCNGLLRRYATVLIYLNHVDEGGETIFPMCDCDPSEAHLSSVDSTLEHCLAPQNMQSGVCITPRKGDAVLWYNYNPAGELEPRAVHAALPVLQGEKWAANLWVSITPEELEMV